MSNRELNFIIAFASKTKTRETFNSPLPTNNMNKKLIPLIFILAALFQNCSGPRGADGLPGIDGVNVVGQTFEVDKVNFNTANKFNFLLTYSAAKLIDVRESDVVLIYVLWETTTTGSPVWRLLPQAIDMPRGVTYNFDYSPADFSIFIDAPTDALKASLAAEFTQNQTFRVVVIPSDFTSRKGIESVDYNNYEAVKKYYNLDESKIPAFSVK